MPADTDPKADVFFAKVTDWRDELHALRAILLDSPLTEEFKWRSPVYTFDGHNVAIVWGFKDRATLGFFKGVLLKDPQRILELPGENSRSSKIVNFINSDQIRKVEKTVRDYILEAIDIEKSGQKVDFPKDDLDYPEELIARLDSDDAFKTAFENLTPGRRRGWVLHFSSAKQSATRSLRIDKAAHKILVGKGMNDRP